jgi:hypothetical protein
LGFPAAQVAFKAYFLLGVESNSRWFKSTGLYTKLAAVTNLFIDNAGTRYSIDVQCTGRADRLASRAHTLPAWLRLTPVSVQFIFENMDSGKFRIGDTFFEKRAHGLTGSTTCANICVDCYISF